MRPDHPRRESAHPKTQFLEHVTHQAVVLVAVAAAAPVHQLIDQSLGAQVVDRHTQQWVEVLEGDGAGVRRDQVLQDINGRIGGTVVADPFEVPGQIQRHVGHCGPMAATSCDAGLH